MAEFVHQVTTEEDGMEVREIMREHFTFSSRLRNKIKRNKLVTLNDGPTEGWHRVHTGDVVRIHLPDESSHFEPEPIPLFPVYEDEDLLLLNKQPGLIVHPTKGNPSGTVANALMYRMKQTGEPFKIRFVNRLDRDTSGLLIVAKNAFAQNEITKQMKADTTEKYYIAIVEGLLDADHGTIDAPIGRPDPDDVRRGVMEDGHPSLTHYEVLERYPAKGDTVTAGGACGDLCADAAAGDLCTDTAAGDLTVAQANSGDLCTDALDGFTLIRLRLETGRTHQIRVHMAYIGHPVLSDHLYGTERPELIGRQALHAARLVLTHPSTGKRLDIEAPLPEDMAELLTRL